jgi:hypothetical protein
LENSKISISGGISKLRLLAVLGNVGQFWAEFAALTVAESMPEERLKS